MAVFGMLLITGIWVATTNRVRQTTDEAIAAEFSKNANLALALDVQTNQLLKGIDQLVLLIKAQYEQGTPPVPLRRLVAPSVAADDSFTFVGAVDEHGLVVESLRDAPPTNVADREMFRRHLERDSGELLIAPPVLGRVTGRWVITLSRRINKPDGSFGGLANVSIEPRHLTAIFEEAELGPNDMMSLVLLDGVTLARRRGSVFEFGVDISEARLFRAREGRPTGGYIGPGGVDGHIRVFSYRTMRDYPVFVTVGTSEAGALAPVRRQAQTYYLNATLATSFIVVACAAVIVMIVRQRRASRQLHEQASLLDKAQDAIVVSGLDRSVAYWNKSAERLYGWTAGEAIGRLVPELLFHDADIAPVIRAYDHVLSTGEWAGDLEPRARDGRRLVVESRWTLVRDDAGQPLRILTIDTDVTERRQLERQFYRSQRLESIGTLAGGIAHDLNNVLTPIILAVELLEEGTHDPVNRELLNTVGNSARRGAEMVGQVLSFARGQDGSRVEIKPGELIADVERIMRDTLPKAIKIECRVADGLPSVAGDPTQLHQVLLNLCVNARDAMPDGGHLTVEAASAAVGPAGDPAEAGMAPGPYVVLQVQDTGIGMSREIMDRMFDPFFSTKGPAEGTGLGLSTSRTIVRHHGGHIRVESEVGRGTRFRVYLPAGPAAGPAVAVVAAETLPRGNGQTVLVIDDESQIRLVVQQLLEFSGYRVLSAADGTEGVALFADHHASVDAVVVDMMMPSLGGPDTIQALAAIDPDVQIIAFSGVSASRPSAVAAGPQVKRFLSKPFRADALLTALRDLLAPRRTAAIPVSASPPPASD